MPTLEVPPNPAPPPPPAPPPEAPRVHTRRFGELEQHELIHLLDSLDDDRSRSRFRESIYISLLFYVLIAWLVLYGPRVLWHSPHIAAIPQTKPDELTYLHQPPDIRKYLPKPTKVISDQTQAAQTARPVPAPKTPEQLQAMKPAGPSAPSPPAPRAAAPQPQPAPVQPQPQARPLPPAPQPARTQPNAVIPDAPHPAPSTRPSFSPPQTAGETIARASREAGRPGGDYGLSAPSAHPGLASGAEILSDTMGVDFGPYMRRLHMMVQASWDPLIPEETRPPLNKEGTTVVRWTIRADGTVTAMTLDGASHDVAIDKAAWGAIKGVGQFPPLPKDFHGPELEIRGTFVIKSARSRNE